MDSWEKAVLLRPWKEVLQSIWLPVSGESEEGDWVRGVRGGVSRRPFVRERRFAGSVRSEGEGSLRDVDGSEGGASVARRELLVIEGVGRPTGSLMGVAVFVAVAVAALRVDVYGNDRVGSNATFVVENCRV